MFWDGQWFDQTSVAITFWGICMINMGRQYNFGIPLDASDEFDHLAPA
jgi:hypothetical protein